MICPACQAPNDDSSDACIHCGRGLYALTLGARLASRYEIMGVLGRGGMGVVYLARDLELDETVALKVLRAEIAGSDVAARRFRSEIKLARRIRHRNVCGIHEYGQEGRLRFIVMEYVEGSTLRQVLRQRGRLPAWQAFDVAIEVAEGLQAVHDAGIIHRDLKATNVMLDGAGNVRLMDFGIAKQLQQEETTGITAAAQIVGTPEYMSPEQVRSEKLDGRSDVYSLGILIFELFTGDVPFHGDTPMSVILAHLETPPPLDDARATWLPRSLVPVLRKALAKDRHHRYRSPREVAEALRSARAVLGGPTLIDARTTARGWTSAAAQPSVEAAPESVTAPAPTPVSTPTPIVPATVPLARTRAAAQEVAEPRVEARPHAQHARAVYRVGGGIVVAVFGLVVTSRLLHRTGNEGSGPPTPPAASVAPTNPPAPVTVAAPSASPPRPSASPVPSASAAATTSQRPAVPLPTKAPTRAPAAAGADRNRPSPPPPGPGRPAGGASPVRAPVRGPEGPAAPATSLAPAEETANGTLRFRIVPWAEVTVDDRPIGTTPLRPLSLPPGIHTVRLQHPSYRPLQKRVTIRPGEAFSLEVDLRDEAFPVQTKEP
jgi:predicted Ser/Thr protein kinase